MVRRDNPAYTKSNLLSATLKADSMKNSKAVVGKALYKWLPKELSNLRMRYILHNFGAALFPFQAEKRSGFPHLYEILNHEEEYLYEKT